MQKTANGLMVSTDSQAGQRYQTFGDPKTQTILGQRSIEGSLRSKAIARRPHPKHKPIPQQHSGPSY